MSEKKIYIITRGTYSDYRICAVTDDETEAEKLRIIASCKSEEASIEEWPISPKVEDVVYSETYGTCWKFVLSQKGDVIKCDRLSLVKEPNSFELDRLFGMTAYVFEENRDKALKIAYDHRAKLIAEQLGL